MPSTQSGKAKGRRFQQWVRDLILDLLSDYPIEPDDVKSTPMGSNGEDVQLSPAARKLLPISVECKAHKAIAVYSWYAQCEDNAPKGTTPVLFIKADRKKPLAVISADYYTQLVKETL